MNKNRYQFQFLFNFLLSFLRVRNFEVASSHQSENETFTKYFLFFKLVWNVILNQRKSLPSIWGTLKRSVQKTNINEKLQKLNIFLMLKNLSLAHYQEKCISPYESSKPNSTTLQITGLAHTSYIRDPGSIPSSVK